MIEPHPFQHDMTDRARAKIVGGVRKLVIQAATGAGKTVVGSRIVQLAIAKGKQTLWLSHARELVDQASGTLWDFNIPHGIIMAGRDWAPGTVQVASKDTLLSRAIRRGTMELGNYDIIIVDECRLSLADRWRGLLDAYVKRGAIVIGLDATPARETGWGMGDWWEDMVCGPPTSELIKLGMLVPCQVKAPKPSKEAHLVGDVISHWKRWAEDRQTIVFCQSVKHSMYVRDLFAQAGVAVQHLDHRTPEHLRDQIVADTRALKNQVIVTCNMLTNGWDDKKVSCCVLLCRIGSFTGFKQRVGRILRACPEIGKKDAILIDHAGSIYDHGYMPDDDVDWVLDKNKNIHDQLKNKPPDKKPVICPQCFTAFRGSNKCPVCGFLVTTQAKVVHHKDGMLFDVGRDELAKRDPASMQRCWHYALATMAHRGRTVAAAAQIFFKEYKIMPWHADVMPQPDQNLYHARVSELYPDYMRRKT